MATRVRKPKVAVEADLQAADILRKIPKQRRSRATAEFILEAASQILALRGERAMTTAAVAERAGVSIGTLYQYFADGDALLRAVAERERQRLVARLRELIEQSERGSGATIREFVRSAIQSMTVRKGARRQFALISAAAMRPDGSWRRDEFVDIMASHWSARYPKTCPRSNRVSAFVLIQAVVGALHAAAVADPLYLNSPEFEEALCDLVRAFWVRIRKR